MKLKVPQITYCNENSTQYQLITVEPAWIQRMPNKHIGFFSKDPPPQKKKKKTGTPTISGPTKLPSRMLFLDEPLSGLDSYAAYTLVVALKDLAKANVPVLCTVHQPSSEIFAMFLEGKKAGVIKGGALGVKRYFFCLFCFVCFSCLFACLLARFACLGVWLFVWICLLVCWFETIFVCWFAGCLFILFAFLSGLSDFWGVVFLWVGHCVVGVVDRTLPNIAAFLGARFLLIRLDVAFRRCCLTLLRTDSNIKCFQSHYITH